MHDLCGISVIPNQPIAYLENLRAYYRGIVENVTPELAPAVKPAREPMNWEQASAVMWSAMKTKKRLECGY